jgi:hypothetical protein
VEGWAHYCEQMMSSRASAAATSISSSGSFAESLVRLARCRRRDPLALRGSVGGAGHALLP